MGWDRVLCLAFDPRDNMVHTLMSIRTKRMDIQGATAGLHRRHYLSQAAEETAPIEAEIYAQAMTALQLSYLSGNAAAVTDEDYYDNVMVQAFLHILRLDKDVVFRKQILSRLLSEREL